MFVIVEDNPNCAPDERVFPTFGERRAVRGVFTDIPGEAAGWCAVTGVDESGAFVPATAQRMEDSSDGVAWLVSGGMWGLRFRRDGDAEAWSLSSQRQWGLPFLVLDQSGQGLRFTDSPGGTPP